MILRHREGGSVADVINPALANMEGGDRVFSVTGRGSAGSAAVAATVRELLQDGKASSGAGVWAWVAVPCAEAEDPIGRFAQSFRVWTWPLPYARPPVVRYRPGPRVSPGMCTSLPVGVWGTLGINCWDLSSVLTCPGLLSSSGTLHAMVRADSSCLRPELKTHLGDKPPLKERGGWGREKGS